MKIVFLHDHIPENAPEDDQDVILQCRFISDILSDMGHEPISLPFSLDFNSIINKLNKINPDLVFNLVESVNGNGHLIHLAPKILDEIQMPYTGSRTDTIIATSNKLIAKKKLNASGISTPEWFSLEYDKGNCIRNDGPYIIKSVWEHASKGINQNSVFYSTYKDEFLNQIKLQTIQTGWDCFAEYYIEGREFNLSILESSEGPEVLPSAEILFFDYPEGKFKIVDYPAKWEKESFEYKHTCRCFDFSDTDKNLLEQLSIISLRCWELFKLKGYARIDFRIDLHGNPWVLEVNANPCLAPDSGFVAAAQQAGLSFDQVIERIINAAFL